MSTVYATCIVSSQEFYLQLEENREAARNMSYRLETEYCNETESVPLESIEIGMPIACTFQEDNFWYRGKVTGLDKVNDSGNRAIEVKFVDFGNTDLVLIECVKPLISKFLSIPPLAFQCRLADDIVISREEFCNTVWNDDGKLLCNFISDMEPFIVDLYSPDSNVCLFKRRLIAPKLSASQRSKSTQNLFPGSIIIESNLKSPITEKFPKEERHVRWQSVGRQFDGENFNCSRNLACNVKSSVSNDRNLQNPISRTFSEPNLNLMDNHRISAIGTIIYLNATEGVIECYGVGDRQRLRVRFSNRCLLNEKRLPRDRPLTSILYVGDRLAFYADAVDNNVYWATELFEEGIKRSTFRSLQRTQPMPCLPLAQATPHRPKLLPRSISGYAEVYHLGNAFGVLKSDRHGLIFFSLSTLPRTVRDKINNKLVTLCSELPVGQRVAFEAVVNVRPFSEYEWRAVMVHRVGPTREGHGLIYRIGSHTGVILAPQFGYVTFSFLVFKGSRRLLKENETLVNFHAVNELPSGKFNFRATSVWMLDIQVCHIPLSVASEPTSAIPAYDSNVSQQAQKLQSDQDQIEAENSSNEKKSEAFGNVISEHLSSPIEIESSLQIEIQQTAVNSTSCEPPNEVRSCEANSSNDEVATDVAVASKTSNNVEKKSVEVQADALFVQKLECALRGDQRAIDAVAYLVQNVDGFAEFILPSSPTTPQ